MWPCDNSIFEFRVPWPPVCPLVYFGYIMVQVLQEEAIKQLTHRPRALIEKGLREGSITEIILNVCQEWIPLVYLYPYLIVT